MKKSVWIFLFAVLLPSVVLGWLALRSAEEQQIVFERRTAELYQKETETLAVTVRDAVDAERRVFGETVHRLLAKGDADALARDFTNTLADAWEMKAVGFAINGDGKLVSPSVVTASKKPDLQRFLLGNGGFLTSTEPAIVYSWAGDNSSGRNLKVGGKSLALQGNGNSYSVTANGVSTGKDIAPGSERATASNEPAVLGDAVVMPKLWTLTLGTQAGSLAGIDGGSYGPSYAQAALNAVATPGFGSQNTVVLSGGVVCQVPANTSAFDFTGVMSVQDQKNTMANLGVLLPSAGATSGANATGGATALTMEPKKSVEPLKTETGLLFPEPPAPTPAMPASAPPGAGAAPMPEARMAGGKEIANAQATAALRRQSAAKDAAAATADAPMKAREIDRAKSGPKAKAAAPNDDAHTASKLHPMRDESRKDSAPLAKSMTGKKSADDRAVAPVPLSLPALDFERPSEMKLSEIRREKSASIPATPAAKPAPATKADGKSSILSRSSPQPVAAEPMPSKALSKSEAPPGIGNPEGAAAEQPAITKSGSGTLTSNNAINRQVEPQQLLGAQSAALSTVLPETAEFRSITEEGDDGLVARFVQDKLNLIFWVRPPEAPEMVFGCLVEAGHFSELWKDVLERHNSSSRGNRAALESKPDFVLALLDDRGKPVATQPADASARDWKHPFVASEIGEALPHWEAALYLASPTALAESARGLWRTLAFTIAGAVALIVLGGWLVVADARRQLALAQQKTDFVSNVSHELKTPLTSIRMFAELMHDRPQPAEKQGQYLRIITVEAERLTRLINNVLDFAKMDRRQMRLEKKPLDLCAIITRVWEGHEMHLRNAGFTTRWEAAPGPYPVSGDDDALAQVLVNLLSNAEKYSTERKEVELHSWLDDGWVNVSVLDRGMGVPDCDEKKIFEAFYRAHDSLASGIQGSGLGLTLAQRIVREHGGEIKLEHREGGGSRFTLRMPLAQTRPAQNNV